MKTKRDAINEADSSTHDNHDYACISHDDACLKRDDACINRNDACINHDVCEEPMVVQKINGRSEQNADV